MLVTFLAEAHARDEHGKIVESFRAGERVDFSARPASGERWIKRGVAVAVVEVEVKNAPDQTTGAPAGDGGDASANAADDVSKSAGGASGSKSKR